MGFIRKRNIVWEGTLLGKFLLVLFFFLLGKFLLVMNFGEWAKSLGRSGEERCLVSQCAKMEKSKACPKSCELCRGVVNEDSRKRGYRDE